MGEATKPCTRCCEPIPLGADPVPEVLALAIAPGLPGRDAQAKFGLLAIPLLWVWP
jgi:hypothetical protein